MDDEHFTESHMEEIHAQARQFEAKVKKYGRRVGIVVMGLSAALVTLVAIVEQWHRYDGWLKAFAVFFLVNLTFLIVIELWAEKIGKKDIDRSTAFTVGCILLIMAISLFALP